MIFAAVVAVLLLISSSLIADDARKWNDIVGSSGYSADKLSAAAVCRNFKLQWNPLLFWHLYSGDTSIQGTPLFRGHFYSRDTSIQGTKNLVPVKCSHNLCICYLYLFYQHQWNTKWAFVRKLENIFTCENNMLSSHVTDTWKYHCCYGFIKNRTFQTQKLFK